MGILDRYLEKVEQDKERQNNDLPSSLLEGVNNHLTKEEKKYYDSILEQQRNDPMDMKNVYTEAMSKLTKYTDEDLQDKGLMTAEDIKSIKVLHAYCDECGEELISQGPPMFNPFTMVRICAHKCKCGKTFNLDYAYPRLAFYNNKNEEVKAYGM